MQILLVAQRFGGLPNHAWKRGGFLAGNRQNPSRFIAVLQSVGSNSLSIHGEIVIDAMHQAFKARPTKGRTCASANDVPTLRRCSAFGHCCRARPSRRIYPCACGQTAEPERLP